VGGWYIGTVYMMQCTMNSNKLLHRKKRSSAVCQGEFDQSRIEFTAQDGMSQPCGLRLPSIFAAQVIEVVRSDAVSDRTPRLGYL
jgi:hypothetical protein